MKIQKLEKVIINIENPKKGNPILNQLISAVWHKKLNLNYKKIELQFAEGIKQKEKAEIKDYINYILSTNSCVGIDGKVYVNPLLNALEIGL